MFTSPMGAALFLSSNAFGGFAFTASSPNWACTLVRKLFCALYMLDLCEMPQLLKEHSQDGAQKPQTRHHFSGAYATDMAIRVLNADKM